MFQKISTMCSLSVNRCGEPPEAEHSHLAGCTKLQAVARAHNINTGLNLSTPAANLIVLLLVRNERVDQTLKRSFHLKVSTWLSDFAFHNFICYYGDCKPLVTIYSESCQTCSQRLVSSFLRTGI